MLVGVLLWEVLQLLLAARHGPMAVLAYFDSAANIIDWAIIVFGFAAVDAKVTADDKLAVLMFPESLDVVSDSSPMIAFTVATSALADAQSHYVAMSGLCLLMGRRTRHY